MKAYAPLAIVVLFLNVITSAAPATEPATKPAALTVAVLNFDATLPGQPDFGKQLADTVAASLAGEQGFSLIERAAMSHLLAEHELNMTGLVDTDKAVKIGHLIGAGILVTGRVIPTDKQLTVVAKLIGTETSLVDVVLVKGKLGDDSTDLGTAVGDKLVQRLRESGSKLLTTETPDPFNDLKAKLQGKAKPVLAISVQEMHVTSPRTIDPAVDTELRKMFTECGFDVVDKDEDPGKRGVEVVIKGEGISEFGGKVSNISTCSGRVELNLVTFKEGKTLFADRETSQSAGLQENIAAKGALQKAAHAIGLRILDHFVQTLPEAKKQS